MTSKQKIIEEAKKDFNFIQYKSKVFGEKMFNSEISDEEARLFEKLPKLILAGCFTGILLGVMIVIGLLAH